MTSFFKNAKLYTLAAILLTSALTACGEKKIEETEASTTTATATSTSTATTVAGSNMDIAKNWIDLMETKKYEDAYGYFDETMQTAVPKDQLPQVWLQTTEKYGKMLSIGDTKETEQNGYIFVSSIVSYEKANLPVNITLNTQQQVAGINFGAATLTEETGDYKPQETDVIVDSGEGYPLKGIISHSASSGKSPAVVLVHGSGPNNMDETVGLNSVFKQLAHELAKNGVTVLRYNKRTYTYGSNSAKDMARFTVMDETINDAVAAVKLLQKEANVDKVYVLGHSLGGMLVSRIESNVDGVAGIISFAGSPRKLWEVQYDQNQAGLEALKEAKDPNYDSYVKLVQDQYNLAKSLSQMDDDTALKTTVFGIPAWYSRDLEKYDAADLVIKSGLPALFMQGNSDFQVYADTDFKLWKEKLASYDKAQFKQYDGLNHLFMQTSSDPKISASIDDYNIAGKVDAQVIKDIVEFVGK